MTCPATSKGSFHLGSHFVLTERVSFRFTNVLPGNDVLVLELALKNQDSLGAAA
jgi:hypothetical protein